MRLIAEIFILWCQIWELCLGNEILAMAGNTNLISLKYQFYTNI